MGYRQLEHNVQESFRQAKRDIIRLQAQVIDLSKKQEDIMKELLESRENESSLSNKMRDLKQARSKVTRVTKIVNMPSKSLKTCKPKHTHYLASKTGNKFHVKNCPFAKNIKPKSKIIFKTKAKALNKGYKPCNCVK